MMRKQLLENFSTNFSLCQRLLTDDMEQIKEASILLYVNFDSLYLFDLSNFKLNSSTHCYREFI